MHSKKFHQLPHSHLQAEFLAHGFCFFPGNAGNLSQPLRFPLHNQQGLLAEMLHDPRRRLGANALDDAAAEIIQDFQTGLRHQPLQKFRLELPSVAGVGAPLARHHQPFAHRGQGDGADHRHILTAAHVHAKDGIAVFVILIYHGADGALQNLQIFRQVVLSPILSASFSGAQTVTPRSVSQSRSASLMPKSTMVSSSRSSPSSRSHR